MPCLGAGSNEALASPCCAYSGRFEDDKADQVFILNYLDYVPNLVYVCAHDYLGLHLQTRWVVSAILN